MTITAAIVGYGNLGRSAEKLIKATEDFELFGIFSRRDNLDTQTPVYPVADAAQYADQVDVLLLCLGSATDIPEQATGFAEHFTTVDTYDNHSKVPEHYQKMNAAAESSGHLSIISTGWDPGLFSMNRVLGQALFPQPVQNTFWGKGLSQGHSDAVRRVEGVKRGVQYTVPREDAIAEARAGGGEDIVATEAHARVCYIVADETDHDRIREEIVNMPAYFAPYQTTVNFISEEEFERDHLGMPHGGHVITTGDLGGSQQSVEFTLELESNPDFTAAAMVAFARAAARLAEAGETGARSVLEIPLYLLSTQDHDTLLAREV
ncbi:diaminopimelate dehydrogenase [Auritidibacter ignavus]|uniref:Meso-diaminopimelate D-dehydrogenase n=1 Tax=Auritidibacter ignavus TaxID=678932 RepID=A0AAJ6DC35_9MICC|nr:diaminopimelate dehydrogenase [Auritidibacter ignavus]WGH93059.1 diaminopimelate dehydrogenase [Auritidibacter ignavus]